MLSDFRRGYAYQNLLLGLKDKLYNTETNEKINDLQANYESEKKQAQIDMLTKEREVQQLTLQRQHELRNTASS